MGDSELYRLCQEYGANARMWSRKFSGLLPEVEKRRLYLKHGFYTLYEFAAKLGGMGHKTVDEVLRTYSKVADKPLLKAQIEEFGWAKVRAVTPLVEIVEEKKLVEMVKTLPRSALTECVHELKKPKYKEFETITFKVDKKTALEFRKFQQQMEKQAKTKIPLGKVLRTLLTKIEPAPPIPNKLGKSKKITRYIPVQQKRALIAKHSGRCAYPNCNKPYQEIHHPQRFAITKTHEGIVPLCRNQHRIGLLA